MKLTLKKMLILFLLVSILLLFFTVSILSIFYYRGMQSSLKNFEYETFINTKTRIEQRIYRNKEIMQTLANTDDISSLVGCKMKLDT